MGAFKSYIKMKKKPLKTRNLARSKNWTQSLYLSTPRGLSWGLCWSNFTNKTKYEDVRMGRLYIRDNRHGKYIRDNRYGRFSWREML